MQYNNIRRAKKHISKASEAFWFLMVISMPIIDQVSTILRGDVTEQILSVSLYLRAFIGVGLLMFIALMPFRYAGSIRKLGRYCILFGVVTLFAAILRWNIDVYGNLFRIFWWLALLFSTYSAVQSGILRRSVLLNAIVFSAIIQLISLAATPLIGHLGRGINESTYIKVGAVSGLFYSTKAVSQSLALSIPVIWIRFKRGPIRIAYIFFILLGIASTFSRTAIVAAIFALIILFITDHPTKKSKKLKFPFAAPILLALVVLAVIRVVGWERMSYRWTMEIGSGYFGSGRYQFWDIAFLEWVNADVGTMIFGSGLGASLDVLEPLYGRIWSHNDFLEILLGQGMIGLIIFVMLLLCIRKLLCKTWKINRINGPAWALLVAFVTCSFLSGMIYQLDVIGPFVIAFAAMSPVTYGQSTSFFPGSPWQSQRLLA